MSFFRFTEQTVDPPQPGEESGKKTGRFFAKLVGGILKPLIIDSDGNVSDFVGPDGPTGPTGPAGPTGPPGTVAKISVADIDNPGAEMNAINQSSGSPILAQEVSGSGAADEETIYFFDLDGPPVNSPYVLATSDGGTTRWIAQGGKYDNQTKNFNSSLTSQSTIIGTNLQTISQVEAEAGVSALTRLFTAERVKQAIAALSPTGIDPKNVFSIYEDFVTGNEDTDELGAYGWRVSKGGTGNQLVRLDAVVGHPGIMRFVGGTAAAGRAVVHLGQSGFNTMVLGGGEIVWEHVARLTGVVNQHQRSLSGFCDPVIVNGAILDGVFVGIENGDTNWQLFSANGGVTTKLDLGVAFATGSWERLGFVVNAAGTSIEGFANGVSQGTIVTNIPTIPISPIVKSDALSAGGGTATPFDVDVVFAKQTFTTSR